MANPTLIIHHCFTGLALVIMALRLVCRRALFHKFNFGDFCTMAAMLCAAARGGMIHVVLVWGTNNISPKVRAKIDFTPEEIYRRTIGSKLTIANRPIYNSYLWLQKLVILHFFLHNFHSSERKSSRYILWSYGFVFFATWVAAQIVGFTECDPIHLYWQVLPPPGRCVQAQVQLVTLGVLNIVTDFMLLVLPLPTLMSLQTPWRKKIRLYVLCALGMFIIAITVIRLPINALNATVQANRTTWASTELLTAAIVVNAPTLYGAFNNLRRKSQAGNSASKSYHDEYSNTRAFSQSARNRLSHRPTGSNEPDDDDDEVMLRVQRQPSAGSGGTAPELQDQEWISMKSSGLSHSEMERFGSVEPHSMR